MVAAWSLRGPSAACPASHVGWGEPIPHKGRVLTAMSAFWFDLLADVVTGHLLSTDLDDLPPTAQKVAAEADLAGRVMLTRRADMLPVECIVRGYITGSAWKEYRASGTMHGSPLPEGLLESQQLPEPVFTPSTKAEVGDKKWERIKIADANSDGKVTGSTKVPGTN